MGGVWGQLGAMYLSIWKTGGEANEFSVDLSRYFKEGKLSLKYPRCSPCVLDGTCLNVKLDKSKYQAAFVEIDIFN
jgi:hypothetical protein